jgi:hypothetical protein
MTKADLIHAMAERTGLSRPEAAVMVESMVVVLEEALQRGEFVQIAGFGRFIVRRKAETGAGCGISRQENLSPSGPERWWPLSQAASFGPSSIVGRSDIALPLRDRMALRALC